MSLIHFRYNEAFQKEFIKLIPTLSIICGNVNGNEPHPNPRGQGRKGSIVAQRPEVEAPVVFNGSAVELPAQKNTQVAEVKILKNEEDFNRVATKVKNEATMV